MTWDTTPGRVYWIKCADNLSSPQGAARQADLWPLSVGPWTDSVNITEMEWTDTNQIPLNQNYRIEIEVQQ